MNYLRSCIVSKNYYSLSSAPDSVEVKFGNSMYNSSEDSGYISIDIVKAGNNLSPFSIQVVLGKYSVIFI